MKGFFIEITNNLLEPKHRIAMRESVWLFMWLLDKMTSISEEGIGKVLGGKPIKFEDIKAELGISTRTYRRWLDQLKEKGYINVLRTPYGCVLTVNKARKRFGRYAKNAERCATSVQRYATNGTSNIRQRNDTTKDNTTIIINNKTNERNERFKEMKKDLLKKMEFSKV